MKIEPLYTVLPFYEVPLTYSGVNPVQTPFYFQKAQCERDCFYGTITDRNHLPPFIVRIPINENPLFQLTYSTGINFEVLCADGSNVFPLVPDYYDEIIAFIVPGDLAAIVADGPTIGDKYWLDDGTDCYFYVWNGVGWDISVPNTPQDNYLMNVTSEGFVYAWSPDPESTETNPCKQGEWVKTLNGFQLCNIGDFTYLIYNGFDLEEMPCGLKQVRITPDFPETPDTTYWLSELVDIRDFDPENNEYHRLNIDNNCALGNIPYADVRFTQWYYFEKDALVGVPESETKDTKEDDGLGNEILTFRKITKFFTLDTQWIPEYIIDFLQFATQHNILSLSFPKLIDNQTITTSQYKGTREIDNDNFEATNEWIDFGCYGQVTLKISLVGDVTKTSCCEALDKEGCIESSFDVLSFSPGQDQDDIEALPPSTGDCFLIQLDATPDPTPGEDNWFKHDNEIACWNGSGWDYTIPTNNLIINRVEVGFENLYFWNDVNEWKILSSVELVSKTAFSILVKGFVLLGVSGYLYYKKSSDFNWTLKGIFTPQELSDGQNITGLDPETLYDFRILAISNNCDYGFGPIFQTGTPPV